MLTGFCIGQLGQDAQVRELGERKYLCFSMATENKSKEGVTTTWVSVMRPVKEGSKLIDCLKTGTQVFVSGNLTAKIYKTAAGDVAVSLNIYAEKIQLLIGGVKKVKKNEEAVIIPPLPPEEMSDESSDLPF